jgi:hypothetical protein
MMFLLITLEIRPRVISDEVIGDKDTNVNIL